MKNRFLVLALLILMWTGATYAEDSGQPPADPTLNASANTTDKDSKCSNQPAVVTEGDPQAPQNQVEYGGGA